MNIFTDQTTLISTNNAQPHSGEDQLFPPISCEIKSGQLICLMGLRHSNMLPYLRLFAGIDPPEFGEVWFLGKHYSDLSVVEKRQLHLQLGFILSGSPLLSVLSGTENLKLAARYHQLGNETQIEEKAKDILAELPYPMADYHLMIARHLILDPKALFIDSPFEGLDYRDKDAIAGYLVHIVKDKNITVVTCNVDLFFANQFADQIIFCDYRETLAFNNWQTFYQSTQANIRLLFEHEHVK